MAAVTDPSNLPPTPPTAAGHNAVVVAQGSERWGATCACGQPFSNMGRGYSTSSDAFTAWARHRDEVVRTEQARLFDAGGHG